MVRNRLSKKGLPLAVAVTTAAAMVTGLASTTNAGAAPTSKKLAPGIETSDSSLTGKAAKKLSDLPAGVPKKGQYSFLLSLDAKSTLAAAKGASGKSAARSAAKAQGGRIATVQRSVTADLPSRTSVLYKTHSVLAGVAVRTDVKNFDALRGIDGVTAVYPITPKKRTNSYAVPLQGAPQAWVSAGDRGANSTIAIIDTGIDYTHTDFGGAGTKEAFDEAGSAAQQANPTVFPTDKVVGGYDLAGDDYNSDPTSDTYNPVPSPDANPLDCNGHGSHVAGTAAGLGVNADGSTYTGSYNKKTPFDDLKIGPGMAPEAKLYAFRVFGCDGSTDLTGAAIERAIDPNQDDDPSDHVDVANLSLGSDFSSPQDADTLLVKKATDAGVTMVISSGNNGDLYDTGGSPGNAPSALTVAASEDAQAVVDTLNVTAPAAIAGGYPAERSIAYDWATKPDLAGDIYALTDPTNLTGCKPLNDTDAAAVKGKIGFVNWHDAVPECGSVARSKNLSDAGAIGFVFGSDAEAFSAGITGSALIPGVLVAKSGADAIRSSATGGATVSIGSTTANGTKQDDEALNDTLTGFTSRGIRGLNNVKPDVTAVGGSVFSAAVGTGTEGINESGTSMAAPMTAGLAGLVTSQHPEWTAEQVKADIMNTANQNLFTKPNHEGRAYAPNRVGTGRIDAKAAVANKTLAYVVPNADGTGGSAADLKGVVSASFGPLEVTADTTLTKTIKVQNTGLSKATYAVSFKNRTTIPGAEYSVSPASVTVDPRSSTTVTVTLTITKAALTKTIDKTVERETAGNPREYVADASGLVVLAGDGVPNLRVPVYAAPRPTSTMTQAASVTLPSSGVQSADLPLTGGRINQGTGLENVTSTVAGFELAATSPEAPTCTTTVTSGCTHFADEKSADIKYVGVTSDAPQLNSIGEQPLTDGNAYFAVSTWGPWRSPAGFQELDVYIDSNGDGVADVVTYTTRLLNGADQTDVLVATTTNLTTGKSSSQGINARLGDTDTALFDSDTLVLPVALKLLPGVTADKSRISYVVQGYSGVSAGAVDSIGDVTDAGKLVSPLTTDVLKPGVTVAGSYNGDTSPLLYADSPGTLLKLRRDATAYAADKGKGALIVHFHNKVGNKAQVVAINRPAATVAASYSATTVKAGTKITVSVTVSSKSGPVPTGTVRLFRTSGANSPVAASGVAKLVNGKAPLGYRPTATGKYTYEVRYTGDVNYLPGKSASKTLTITK